MEPQLVQPGELRHKVQVLAPDSSVPDAFGQPDTQWSFQWESWARIRTLSQRELASPDIIASQVTHEIAMRWPGGNRIDASMRIIHGEHTYKVQTFNNVLERNITLLILALEIDGSE